MPKEIYPSSYVCDYGEQCDHSERTIRELKEMSKKRRQTLIADDEKHEIIFEKGDFVAMWCPVAQPELPADPDDIGA